MNFDEYQEKIVHSDDKDVVVLAGAGSGKTHTLLGRIARLVNDCDAAPESILVLTFTKAAVSNLEERYDRTKKDRCQANPTFCTFHSFCYRILSECRSILDELGYMAVPRIIESDEYEEYVNRAINLASCKLSAKAIERERNRTKRLAGRQRFEYENFIEIYHNFTRRNNVIDYTTLCDSVCRLFSSSHESVEPIKSRYRYLFVDEFQDTDEAQFEFVKSMDRCDRMLVGDALQNIYQFRGCSNKPMKELVDSEDWMKFELPVNYRSTRQICRYVNKASSNFRSKDYMIELASDREGPEVTEVRYAGRNSLQRRLVSEIKKLSDSRSIAVLCRTNYEADACRKALDDDGIDCDSKDESHLSDLLDFFLCDSNSRYEILASRLSESDYMDYKNKVMHRMPDEKIFESCPFESLGAFLSDVCSVKNALSIEDANRKAFVLCNMFGVEAPNGIISSNRGLLQYVLEKVEQLEAPEIYVGTIHSAKGLEFDSVLIPGVGDSQFRINSEETENLFYTACTRARNNLIVFRQI